MDFLQAIILGTVEGFTEFLPVSSTGHLIIISDWLNLPQTETNKAFEVIIQFAAILAVILNYKDKFTFKHMELWKKVVLAFLPIGSVGFLFHKQLKELFSIEVVAIMFIIGGIIFLIVEYFHKEDSIRVQNVVDLSYKQALWIGIAQVFALIPGTSRAGATIIGALLAGLGRKASAEFSFLLALPVLASASAFDLLKHYKEFADTNMSTLAIGFSVSFIVAYLTMKLFIRFLEKFSFVAFGVYRIIFGCFLLWTL